MINYQYTQVYHDNSTNTYHVRLLPIIERNLPHGIPIGNQHSNTKPEAEQLSQQLNSFITDFINDCINEFHSLEQQ